MKNTMIKDLVYNLIKDLTNHKGLLTDTKISKSLKGQIDELINMLEKLPSDSKVLLFIIHHLSTTTSTIKSVDAKLVNGLVVPLQRWKSFGNNPSANGVNTYSGVYLWRSVCEGWHYIGSTINHRMRTASHISKVVYSTPGGKLQQMHKWARENGGITSLQWTPVYTTLNYFSAFVQEFPLYNLTVDEAVALKAFSALVPRILEQSLLLALPLSWNIHTYVHLKWLYSIYKDPKPVSLLDFDTKEPIREPFLNRDHAVNALTLTNWSYRLHINNLKGFYCYTVGRKVILKDTHIPLEACVSRDPIRHYYALKNWNRKRQ